MDLNFINQLHEVVLSPRAWGDIEYKQRHNWSSKNRIQRERASLMFNRIHQALYNLANTDDFTEFDKVLDDYQYTLTDKFAIIIFQLYEVENKQKIIYVTEFLFPYKKDPDSWWYIVESTSDITQSLDKDCEYIMRCYDIALRHWIYGK